MGHQQIACSNHLNIVDLLYIYTIYYPLLLPFSVNKQYMKKLEEHTPHNRIGIFPLLHKVFIKLLCHHYYCIDVDLHLILLVHKVNWILNETI